MADDDASGDAAKWKAKAVKRIRVQMEKIAALEDELAKAKALASARPLESAAAPDGNVREELQTAKAAAAASARDAEEQR